jgi:hypothetical protein
VFQNQKETVYRSGAEVLTSKNNLAVSVLVDVLYKAVAAIEGTTNTVHKVLNRNNTSLGVHIFHFAINVFENGANHAHNCNNERAKQHRAQIVSDKPPVATHNPEVTTFVGICREIP